MNEVEPASDWSALRQPMLDTYLTLLAEHKSPLLGAGPAVQSQLRSQFLSTIDEAAGKSAGDVAEHISSNIGETRAASGIHPSQSLAAANLIFAAALPTLASYLGSHGTGDPLQVAALRLNAVILRRMSDAAASYVEYLLDKAVSAHREEARRLSRELHDVVGPNIAVGLQGLDLIEHYLEADPDAAMAKVNTTRGSLEDAMLLVRSLSAETRMVVEPGQLSAALSEHLAALSGSIHGSVHEGGDLTALSPHRTNEVFLILREAVRNAARHGDPSQIVVDLDMLGTTFVGTVDDNGTGFDANIEPRSSTGLASMRERAALLGATLTINSQPGRTTLELRVPLPRSDH